MKKFWTRNESGDSEIISVLFVIPIIVFLLFTMIEMGMFFNTKAQVESANRDGVRTAALWGGVSHATRLNNTGKPVATIIDERLGANSKSSCSVAGSSTGIASNAGQRITCTTTYAYQPVASGIFMFGLESVIQKGITVTESSYSEVGYN